MADIEDLKISACGGLPDDATLAEIAEVEEAIARACPPAEHLAAWIEDRILDATDDEAIAAIILSAPRRLQLAYLLRTDLDCNRARRMADDVYDLMIP